MQKVKRKQKRREKIERGEDTGPTKKMLKKNTMHGSSCDIRVAIDCSFDDLMAEKVSVLSLVLGFTSIINTSGF